MVTLEIKGGEKVRVYRHPNPEIRSFLTGADIYPPRVGNYSAPFDCTDRKLQEGLGFIEVQMIRDIMAVPGITKIAAKPKEIRVSKNTSCSWDEIEKAVINAIERAIMRKKIKIIKDEE